MSVHLTIVSILQLTNGIQNDLEKITKYFNETAIFAFLRIPLVPSAAVFPNNLPLYSKDLKVSLLTISAL